MRHMVRGRQLSRDTEHRKSLRRSLVQSLFEHGKIRTTLPKAQEVKGLAEKLITLARENNLTARRRVISILRDRRLVDEEQEFTGKTVVQRLFEEVAPKFAGKSGGYTRITKLPVHRIGDGGSLVLLSLTTDETLATPTGTVRRAAGLRQKRNEKKRAFASKVLKARKGEGEAAKSEAPAAPAEGQSNA